MKKKFKRILAFILPAIILIPCIVVFSDDPLPSELYIGSSEIIYKGTVSNVSSGTGWRYEKDTNTLYLTNANIDGVESEVSNYNSYGIYADGDLNIKISGENNVSALAPGVQRSAAAIIVTGKLSISADDPDATLNIKTEDSTSLTMYAQNTGIRALGGFNISGGTINIKVGAAQGCNIIGIEAWADSYISGSATLNIESGNGTNHSSLYSSTGIDMSGNPGYNLYVSGGASVTSSSGTSDNEANGINVANLYVSDNASVTGISVEGTRKSYGIQGNVIMSGAARVIGMSKDSKNGIYGSIDLQQATEGYYWRISETGDFTKSGTKTYWHNRTNSYVELKLHEHEFSSTFEYDADMHWKSCTADCPEYAQIDNGTHDHDLSTGECSCGHSIPFTIATQPNSLSAEYTYKTEPKLSVNVNTFGSESISYQWYEGNNTETGTILTDATQSTYNVPTGKTTGEYSYYCVVTSGSYTETSSIATLTVNAKSISDGEISGVDETYTYTGSVINPNYVVKVDGKTLTENTDYTVTYQKDGEEASPLDASDDDYTIIINGINNYTGQLTTTFKINKATPDLGDIYISNTEVTDNTSYEDIELQRTNTNPPGELKLDETTIQANKNTYSYTFTPEDLTNYEKVTGEVTINVKDTKEPTAQIKVGDKKWNKFTYEEASIHELITKDNIEVIINTEDDQTGSGIKKVEYLLSGSLYDNPALISGWTTLGNKAGEYKITIKDNMVVHVYVKVTDNDGNTTVVNTPILVKYEDVTDLEKDILFTKASNENVSVKIDFKDNAIKEIKYGKELIPTYHYQVTEDGIIFSAEYLDTFAASNEPYQFVVSYYPSGAIIDEFEMPTTTINLTVEKATPAYIVPTNLTGTYGDKLKSINLPAGFSWDNPDEILSAAGKKTFIATYTPEDTNSYNIVKDVKITVNVEAKSIANAKVTLGDSLTYNGKSQTQTIKSVVLDGEEITYKVTGDKATKVGTYELTIEGTGNFTGTIKVTYKISPDTSILDNLTEENVTIKDKEVIEEIKDSIENSNATEEEKKEYQDILDKSEELLDKIEELEKLEEEKKEENNNKDKENITSNNQETNDKEENSNKDKENTTSNNQNSNQSSKDDKDEDEDDEISIEEIEKELDKYTEETVKVNDKETIQNIIAAIDKQIASDNITKEEKVKLEEKKEEAEKLLDKITELEESEITTEENEDNDVEDKESENKDSKNIFIWIAIGVIGAGIIIWRILAKKKFQNN